MLCGTPGQVAKLACILSKRLKFKAGDKFVSTMPALAGGVMLRKPHGSSNLVRLVDGSVRYKITLRKV